VQVPEVLVLQWACGLKSVAVEIVARLGTVAASKACDLGWSMLNDVFPEGVSTALVVVPLRQTSIRKTCKGGCISRQGVRC